MAGRRRHYSPVKLEPARYPLAGGVDTKVHGYVLPAPKLQVCENAYIEQTGSLRRRFGRQALPQTVQGSDVPTPGTTSSWAALATYKGDLLGFTQPSSDNTRAYAYSDATDTWNYIGSVESPRGRSENVAKSGSKADASTGDSATAVEITVHAFEEFEQVGANYKSSVRITVVDLQGVTLRRAYTLFYVIAATEFALFGIKCVTRGTLIYIFWFDGTNIRVATIDASSITGPYVFTPGSVVVTSAVDAASPCFDVVAGSDGVFIAWNDSTANRISYAFVTTAGALLGGSTATQATVGNPGSISVAAAVGLAVYAISYAVGTGGASDVYALMRTWSGSAWTTLVGPSGALDTALTKPVFSLACVFLSAATTLRIFYTEADPSFPLVRQAEYLNTGASTSRITTLPHSVLASKAYFRTEDLRIYFWAHSGSLNITTAPTRFLVRDDGFIVTTSVEGNAAFPIRANMALPQIQLVGSTQYWATAGYWVGNPGSVSYGVGGLRRICVEFSHPDAFACVESHDALYMAGGFLQEFDGESFREAAFLRPLNTSVVSAVKSTGAGSLTALAIYSYCLVYEDTNLVGRRLRGTNLGAFTPTALTGTQNTITLTIPTLAHTRRAGTVIAVYRTLANPDEDAPFYRVGEVANDPAATVVTFVDKASDLQAGANEQWMGNTGEVDNTSLPAGHLIAIGLGRVLLSGFADAPSRVAVSKTVVDGRPLEFSDFLPTIELPLSGGEVTALAVMNETAFAFKTDHIYRARGDGPNNLGIGEFFPPEMVSAETGTSIARSVVVTPMGLCFEGQKGKMILPPTLQLGYFGAPLEKLTAPGTCRGATIIPTLQQVRWSYDGTTHVYDYYHQQWYVFTHQANGPTVLWKDQFTAPDGDLVVYDSPSIWTDAGEPYVVTLRLGWVSSAASLHGDLRARALSLRGESLGAHNLSIAVAYDGAVAPEEVISGAAAAAGPLEPQWRLKRNIFSMIEVTIRDALLSMYGFDTVVNGPGFRLEELAFEMGLRTDSLGRKG